MNLSLRTAGKVKYEENKVRLINNIIQLTFYKLGF